MTEFKPLHNNVLIKRLDESEKTTGGIFIPDTAKEKPSRGEVIAIGNGTADQPMTVAKGDIVLFEKWGGTEVKIDGEDLLIMSEEKILGILKK